MQVKITDIEMAIEFVSPDMFGSKAYINIETGEIHYAGGLVDESEPSDSYENGEYLSIPGKSDLDLGASVVIDFVDEYIPEKAQQVYKIFNRKGAYSRFKDLLESLNQLDNWFNYEQEALREAALEWCRENNIDVSNET